MGLSEAQCIFIVLFFNPYLFRLHFGYFYGSFTKELFQVAAKYCSVISLLCGMRVCNYYYLYHLTLDMCL